MRNINLRFLPKSYLAKKSYGEKTIRIIAFILFTLYSVAMLAALGYLLFCSIFMDKMSYLNYKVYGVYEFGVHFDNYLLALQASIKSTSSTDIFLPQMFFNSIWYCLIMVAGGVLMSAFTGYVISKYEFRGRNVIYAVVIFSLTIPVVGTSGALLKFVNDIGVYNSPLLVILMATGGFGFSFMVMHAFFKNVSWNYVEAVLIDGGGHFTAFFQVMLPQAAPSLITLGILTFIGCWNDYTTPLLLLPDYPTIASGVYKIQITAERTGNKPYFFAALILSIIPVIILYSIFSDKIMKNFSIGGLKG